MSETEQLKQMMQKLIEDAKTAIDQSILIRQKSPASKKEVTQLWQDFLGQFMGHIRMQGKSTGENLLAGLTFPRFRH